MPWRYTHFYPDIYFCQYWIMIHVGGRMMVWWTFHLTWEGPYSDMMKGILSMCLAGRHLGSKGK